MDFSPSQRTRIQYQFESFCKKVLHGERCDYLRELLHRAEWELCFSDIPPLMVDNLYLMDSYDIEQHNFEVCGHRIQIQSDQLAEALLDLGMEAYSILLLSYCLGLSDRQIGELLGQTRSKVQRNRQRLIAELKTKLKE